MKGELLDELKEVIENSNNIVFFGGAGVSTESGVPDFRSADGLYRAQSEFGMSPEEMISHTFFMRDTETFFRYYKTNMIYQDARPNDAHKALAKLEEMGKLKAVVTQNIDGLHQAAGSKNVLELHGSIHRCYCMQCGRRHDPDVMNLGEGIPRCSCGGIIRPDIVLYEEALDQDVLEKSVHYIRHADILIVGGTSLAVYPAAGLLNYYRGSKLVLVNRSATPYDSAANLVIHEKIGDVFSQI